MAKKPTGDQEFIRLMDATVRSITQRVAAAGLHGLDPFAMITVMHAATEEVVASVLAGYDLKMQLLPEPDDHLREVQLRDACRDLATMANQQLLALIDGWEAKRATGREGHGIDQARTLTAEELRRMFRASPGRS